MNCLRPQDEDQQFWIHTRPGSSSSGFAPENFQGKPVTRRFLKFLWWDEQANKMTEDSRVSVEIFKQQQIASNLNWNVCRETWRRAAWEPACGSVRPGSDLNHHMLRSISLPRPSRVMAARPSFQHNGFLLFRCLNKRNTFPGSILGKTGLYEPHSAAAVGPSSSEVKTVKGWSLSWLSWILVQIWRSFWRFSWSFFYWNCCMNTAFIPAVWRYIHTKSNERAGGAQRVNKSSIARLNCVALRSPWMFSEP